jgi:hypothetical protein
MRGFSAITVRKLLLGSLTSINGLSGPATNIFNGHLYSGSGQFRRVVPITHIEPPAAIPADDELLIKSLKRPAIQAVRLDGSCKSEFSER